MLSVTNYNTINCHMISADDEYTYIHIYIYIRNFEDASFLWALARYINCRVRMCRECRDRFPRHRFQRKPLVSDRGMHHGTCDACFPFQWTPSLAFLIIILFSGAAFGLPGRLVILRCADSIMNVREELEWRYIYPEELLLARGVYVDGVLTNTSYHHKLAKARAELSPDGSLTIQSYEERDEGVYQCYNGYRPDVTRLITFSMYLSKC